MDFWHYISQTSYQMTYIHKWGSNDIVLFKKNLRKWVEFWIFFEEKQLNVVKFRTTYSCRKQTTWVTNHDHIIWAMNFLNLCNYMWLGENQHNVSRHIDETNASEGSSKPYKFDNPQKIIKTTQMLGLIRNPNIVPYNLNLHLRVHLNLCIFLKKNSRKMFYIISLKVN
jgi:hypothetical protein